MTAPDAYCELCELPLAQCVHGQPPPPKPAPKPPPKPRKRAVPKSRAAEVSSKPVTRRWTPPEVLKPWTVSGLAEGAGELDADEVFLELESANEDRLLPGDRETTPEGEPRWQYAARRARVALINEGMMTKGVPGVWKLADRDHEVR